MTNHGETFQRETQGHTKSINVNNNIQQHTTTTELQALRFGKAHSKDCLQVAVVYIVSFKWSLLRLNKIVLGLQRWMLTMNEITMDYVYIFFSSSSKHAVSCLKDIFLIALRYEYA